MAREHKYWIVRTGRLSYLQIEKPYGHWAFGIYLNLAIIAGCLIWWAVK